MALPQGLRDRLTLPVVGAPLFIVSSPELVLAQCKSGIIGAFPALNARPKEKLEEWLYRITEALEREAGARPGSPVAPFAVNQIIHPSNDRLDHDLDLCVKYRVPIIITSLRAPGDFIKRFHAYGGLVFHDVTNVRHAEKALEAGTDGLILVCAGAGGHAGTLSPFALLGEVRRFFDGPIVLSGAITTGADVLAAQALGADLAYMGTRFIASDEANADARYKQMIVDSSAKDIVYSPFFSGVHGNYLRPSIAAAGLDPDNLPAADRTAMNFGSNRVKPWRDIWSAGQGVGKIREVLPAADIIEGLQREYRAAFEQLSGARRAFG